MSSTRAFLITAAALATASCSTLGKQPGETANVGITPTEQFPLATVEAPEGILLAPHDYGLSRNQAAALTEVADRWFVRRDGVILIEAPAGGGQDAAATAYGARDALADFGVPRDSIRVVGYEGGPGPAVPIRVSYLGRQAKVDDCSAAWPDLTKTGGNKPPPNFGCSVNSNLAAMIVDPADIDRPRTADPVDAGRRQAIIDKYRAGQVTSSERDQGASGAVSRAVN